MIDNNLYKKEYMDVPKENEICIIDGKEYKISNLRIPYGIFSGRGNNKYTGCIRKVLEPKDVIVNSTVKIPVPKEFSNQ